MHYIKKRYSPDKEHEYEATNILTRGLYIVFLYSEVSMKSKAIVFCLLFIASGLVAATPGVVLPQSYESPFSGFGIPPRTIDSFSNLRKTYNDRGVFSRYIDLLSATEYVYREDAHDLQHSQLVAMLKAELKLPPYIGLEMFYNLMNLETEVSYSESFYRLAYVHRVYGLGVGLPDPQFLKVMLYLRNMEFERKTKAVPAGFDYIYDAESEYFLNARFVIRKDVMSDRQKLVMGFEYDVNDMGSLDIFYSEQMAGYYYLMDEFFTYPAKRFTAYSYVTDISPQYNEPVFLEGIAPSQNPLSQTSKVCYFMGMRYLHSTYDAFLTKTEKIYKHDFRADVNLNLTPIFGVDLAYRYRLHQSPGGDSDLDIKQVALRFNILDLDIIRIQPLVEYQMLNEGNQEHKLNVALHLISQITKHASVRLFGRMNNDWDLKQNPFDVYQEEILIGGSLGIRF